MQCRAKWMVVMPMAVLPLLSCQQAESSTSGTPPARVEHIEGSQLSRVILTEKAAERLGVQTVEIEDASIVPYSAVLYDANGDTWVYTNPERLVFVRHLIRIESIQGDVAVLTDGPEEGSLVVTVGAAELFGTEFEVGH